MLHWRETSNKSTKFSINLFSVTVISNCNWFRMAELILPQLLASKNKVKWSFWLAGPQSLGDNTLRLCGSGKPLSSKKCSCFPWTKEQKIILVLVKKCAAFFDQSQTANSAEIYASWIYLVICCVVLVLRYAMLTLC